MKRYVFPEPLREGVILARRGTPAVLAEVRGETALCHYAAGGRLSGLPLEGRPCLLSRVESAVRRTEYTVEAISLDAPEAEKKRWIGVNRFAVPKYVAHYLPRREFADMLPQAAPAARGRLCHGVRADFRMGETFLRLQAPMQQLLLPLPPGMAGAARPAPEFGMRMVRQLYALSERMELRERMILLLCYLYDSPCTRLLAADDPSFAQVCDRLQKMAKRGVEIWQANFRVEPEYAVLIRHYRITPEYAAGGAFPKPEILQ